MKHYLNPLAVSFYPGKKWYVKYKLNPMADTFISCDNNIIVGMSIGSNRVISSRPCSAEFDSVKNDQ